MSPFASDYAVFRFKGKNYWNIQDGWCIRELNSRGKMMFRLFHGYIPSGARNPQYLTAVEDTDNDETFVEFDTFAGAIQYLGTRRKVVSP